MAASASATSSATATASLLSSTSATARVSTMPTKGAKRFTSTATAPACACSDTHRLYSPNPSPRKSTSSLKFMSAARVTRETRRSAASRAIARAPVTRFHKSLLGPRIEVSTVGGREPPSGGWLRKPLTMKDARPVCGIGRMTPAGREASGAEPSAGDQARTRTVRNV